jgi:hypothetical protein
MSTNTPRNKLAWGSVAGGLTTVWMNRGNCTAVTNTAHALRLA